MQRIVIITGASRGIGASIAIEMSQKMANDKTLFLLIARSRENLENIKSKMLDINEIDGENSNQVLVLPYDFSKSTQVEELANLIKKTIRETDLDLIKEFYAFYNHGNLKIGTIETNADVAAEHFQVNVLSVWTLLAAIRKIISIQNTPLQFHINLSTPLSSKPHGPFSLYSSTRTARDMIFKYLALEEPTMRVLNYQPGPVYTDMLKQVYDSGVDMYETFKLDYEGKKLIDPDTSVNLLLDIIKRNKFDTGISIDFFEFF